MNHIVMANTILVVDDDPHIRQLLVFALQKAGFRTIEAEDGEAALSSVAAFAPDLIILDINMPKLDGLEVCRRIRASTDLPVLFLSSRSDEIDRVVGIELGADDYVVKPFSPREVVARAGAILRRTRRPLTIAHGNGILQHGLLTVDGDAWTAVFNGQPVALTTSEFAILRALLAAQNRVLSRDSIIDQVRGPGFALTDRTVDSHVRNLRAKFAAAGATDVIVTRSGIGYALGACSGEPAA